MKQVNKALTKTFACGVAAIGVVAGAGMISAPAQALVLYNGCASTTFCTLGELYGGASIQVDDNGDEIFDKLFDSFTLVPNSDSIDASLIQVTGIDDFLNGGLTFTDTGDQWRAEAGTFPADVNYTFTYHVQVLNPDLKIKDNSLSLVDNDNDLVVSGTNSRAEVSEFVHEDPDFLIPALGVNDDGLPNVNDKDIFKETDPTNPGEILDEDLFDRIDFYDQYTDLWLIKNINLSALDDGDIAEVNRFEQRFSQTSVPEPASILGLAAVGGLGFISKRKKQK